MSEIQIGDRRGPKGPEGERGERGERGHRGHDGHDGDTGPTGPTGSTGSSSSLIKFSGIVTPPTPNFLADGGLGLARIGDPLDYPIAIPLTLRNLAVNIPAFIIPPGGTVTIELLNNGILVPGFVITFAAGDSPGSKVQAAGPVLVTGGPLALRATGTGFTDLFLVLATVGTE